MPASIVKKRLTATGLDDRYAAMKPRLRRAYATHMGEKNIKTGRLINGKESSGLTNLRSQGCVSEGEELVNES